MKNSILSKIIKEVREDKDLTVEVLSILTKIPAKYIEAIEANDFDKIPNGPYVKLYMNQILKVLNIDTKTYILKENRPVEQEQIIDDKVDVKKESEKVKESDSLKKEEVVVDIEAEEIKEEKDNPKKEKKVSEVIEEKIVEKKAPETKVEKPVYSSNNTKVEATTEESGSKKGIIIFVLIILIGVIAFFIIENSSQKSIEEQVSLTGTSTPTDDESTEESEEHGMSTEDSLSRALEIADSLELLETSNKADFEKKNKSNRKEEKKNGWNDPAYKESSDNFVKQKYSDPKNPKLVVRAIDGYAKIKILSKEYTWWKKIDYKDSLVLHLRTSASINFYNAYKCEAEYKGVKIDFKNYKYAKYLFKYSKSFRLQKVFY